MNKFKIMAKALITSAATEHETDPRTVVKLFNYSNVCEQGSSKRVFGQLLKMCKTHKQLIETFIAGLTLDIEAIDPGLNQPELDQYDMLYHCIDNFYFRNVQSFSAISLYPRIEDLFARPPLEIKEDFGTLAVQETKIIKALTWNTEQESAFSAIHKWLRNKERNQIFRLFGYAGTGKTAMSKHVADFVMNEAGKDNVPFGSVLYAAYTGQVCSVLRTKGCLNAQTLHSLLYKAIIDPVSGLCTSFVLNQESPLREAALLIVDEVSMVNEQMAEDLMSFGIPILVLGDPEQLPPVVGEGYFIDAVPDFMLTTIERQSKDNPIVYLATRSRQHKSLKPGRYGDSVIYDIGKHVSDEMYSDHEQIICGLNVTRKAINKRSRRINGKAAKNPFYPVGGDRLMCLRNNSTNGIYNGTIWTSATAVIQKVMKPIYKGSTILRPGSVDVLSFKIRSVNEMDPQGNPYIVKTQCSLHLFNDSIKEPAYRDIAGTDQFDFGYGSSVHKLQGSQFKSVLLFDESSSFRENKYKHQYTAITRGIDKVTILL